MGKMKKIFPLLLVLTVVLGFAMHADAAEVADSGTCGENVTWKLDENGLLTISGTGPMTDYAAAADVPWFSWRDSILTVVVSEGVTTVGTRAFYECYGLTSVAIGEGVTTIGNYAFYQCYNLTDITIPASVTSIEGSNYSLFYSCVSLKNLRVHEDNEVYSSDERGVLFNKDKTKLLCAPGGLDGAYVIPDGVTTIASSAFYDNWHLTSITVPESVTTIENFAFDCCHTLTGITINARITSINKGMFACCESLKSIDIPDTVTAIGEEAFIGCTSLTDIILPEGVTTIGTRAFDSCTSLTNVKLPESVVTIGDDAFVFCSSLKDITIPEEVTSIGNTAFAECSELAEITFGGDAPSIASNAFYNVTATAYYPAGNATWTETVKQNCGGTLTWVPVYVASGTCGENVTWTLDENGLLTISGTGPMENLSNGAPWAENMYKIKAVFIENGVTSISDGAFSACTNMASVSIANSVTSIGQHAFSECGSLTEIMIPARVTSIGYGAFQWCDRLTMIKVDPANPNYSSDANGALYSKSRTVLIRVPGGKSGKFVVPSGVITVASSSFHYCEKLTEVELPDTVTSIGPSVFLFCTKLQEITIPASVTRIEDLAFGNCRNLRQITFKGDAPRIAYNVFSGISATAYYPADNATWTDSVKQNYVGTITWVAKKAYYDQGTCGENLTWTLDENGLLTISGTGPMEEFGYGAPWSDYAYDITAVVLENGVTSISDGAFSTCTNMTSVSIPNSVTGIGQYAFSECSSLTEITIPAEVTSIGYGAFQWCSNLTMIQVAPGNSNYSSDAGGALYNREQTELIRVPGGKTGVFVVRDGVTAIASCAFHNCEQLTQVELPDTVTSIGNSAFLACVNLREITVPASVTAIGELAFSNCRNLKQITFEGDAPQFASNVFTGISATAYYPGNNTAWSAEMKQNYGGTITWEAVGVETIIPTITLKYPTLSFESEVFYNVYFSATNVADVVEMGLLTWYNRPANTAAATYESAEVVIPGATNNAGTNVYMVRSEGVPAKQLGDNMYIRVYAKLSDGTYAYSPVTYYNAVMYANDILANSQSAEMKSLVVAMLNYGAAAQVHFNHNTDKLMNAGLTPEQKALVKAYSSDMIGSVIAADANKVGTFKSNGGFSGAYPSVSFEGAFAINFYLLPKQTVESDMILYCWDLNTYNSVDVLTEENATAKITMINGGTRFAGAYEGIAAKQIDETVFVAAVYETDGVRYSSPVISYSLGAYCKDQIANGSDTMKAFAAETAVYGHYAKAYFASLEG